MSKSYNWLIGNDQQSINATRVVDRKPWFKSVGIKKPFQTGFSLFEYISHLDGYIYQWWHLSSCDFICWAVILLLKVFEQCFDWTRYICVMKRSISSDTSATGINKIGLVFNHFVGGGLWKKIGIGTLTGRKWIADNLCFIIEINDKHLTVLLLNFWNTN